jgi:ABC-2 type transport system permease protein
MIEVCGLTRLIRTTFVAVPRRRAVLAAKAATAGAVALAAGGVLAFASFFLTQAILPGHHRGLSLAPPGAPAQRPGTRTSPD